MDIRDLRYFVETVRFSSFSRAADVLHVTQSAVSKKVAQLEEKVGSPLLIRKGRNLILTDVGRPVYERAQDIIATMTLLHHEIADIKAVNKGTLTIGIPPMINMIFTEVLKEFREQYPHINLQMREEPGPVIEKEVAEGRMEIGMTLLSDDNNAELDWLPIARYPVYALARQGTFPESCTELSFKQLKDLPLALLKDEFAFMRKLHHCFAVAGFEPNIVAQSGQWDWLVSMAAMGMGVVLLPEPFMKRVTTSGLHAVRIIEPEIDWHVAYVMRRQSLSHAAKVWLQLSQEVLAK